MTPSQKLNALFELMRLDRPGGTLLLLWPTLTALWLAAEGVPPFRSFLYLFLVLSHACRGCVANDIVGPNIDPFGFSEPNHAHCRWSRTPP
ncbi:MAG: hypothetical protein CM1200mP9_11810 [Gammaproteobacteria bacterium]|nr:MAG: hypothetical protein CM1200mP9_11810 [Gammaproteobacteria bacterium]